MINRNHISDDYRHAGALSALLNVQAAIDSHTFITRSGDLLCILRADGIDPECLDPDELNTTARHFESALRQLGSGFHVYQYLIKRPFGSLPHLRYPDHPVLDTAIAARIEHLTRDPGRLQRFGLYLVVVHSGPRTNRSVWQSLSRLVTDPRAVWKQAFSSTGASAELAKEIERGQEILASKISGFIARLRDTLNFELLDIQAGFTFLRSLLNFAPHQYEEIRLKQRDDVDFQLCGSTLECFPDHLQLDGYALRVLTLKDPPAQTFPHLLRGLHAVPSSFVLVSEWSAESAASMRALIRSKRRHFHNSKTSLASYLNSGQNGPRDVLVDEGDAAIVNDLGDCLADLELHGQIFGRASFTVVLYDEDAARLKRSVAECTKVFAAHDAQVIEERFNLLNCFLATIPGNGAYNLRRLWLSIANYADLAPIYNVHRGNPRNAHLKDEYVGILETGERTPFFLNLHDHDVAHTVLVGATGSGKSFLLNFLITNLQKYQPWIFILDLGGSYPKLTQLFGGSYLRIGGGSGHCAINPFILAPTPENHQFLFSFLRVLIEVSSYRMTTHDERDLFEQIENLYLLAPDQRRLLTLSNMLNRNLRQELQKWVMGGQYGSWFDNIEDQLTLARFQAFDFEGMDKLPQVLEPLLFYILHRANAAICDPAQEAVFKSFILDEAWRFLRHPTIKRYIEEALKTWRKKNAAVILATQSSADLTTSEVLTTVAESCATQIFLANPGMDRPLYQKLFHLNETQSGQIASLIPKRQMLIKQGGIAKIVELDVDRRSYWLYTNHFSDNQKLRDAIASHGFSGALEILAKES